MAQRNHQTTYAHQIPQPNINTPLHLTNFPRKKCATKSFHPEKLISFLKWFHLSDAEVGNYDEL